MVLEAIYGPEACPPPCEDSICDSSISARVDLMLPEDSLLAVVAAAASEDKEDNDEGEDPSGHKCCLEFLCPKVVSEEVGEYPATPPLIRVSCSALPPSCLRRMTRRLSRIASSAAKSDQPMLHDLVSAASEMLAGDWHNQQPSVPSQDFERMRFPLEESSDEESSGKDEKIGGRDQDWDLVDEAEGGEGPDEEDWEDVTGLEDDQDDSEEEADLEVEAAAVAANQAVAIDLFQQQDTGISVNDAIVDGSEEAGNSLVEDFDSLALGGDDSLQEEDAVDSKAQGDKSSKAKSQPGGLKDHSQGRVVKNRKALSAPAAEAESRKLAEHQVWLEGSEAHSPMRSQRSALPAAGKRSELLEMLRKSRVVVISGATGCGKSTQVPQYILEDAVKSGWGSRCNIIVTQPRRISALGLASRVAAERGEDVGQTVGYSVRLDSKQSARTRILFCTTGVCVGKPRLFLSSILSCHDKMCQTLLHKSHQCLNRGIILPYPNHSLFPCRRAAPTPPERPLPGHRQSCGPG